MEFGGLVTGERVTRRLAAILAADVVGYSRLMGRDEQGTLTRLRGHRTQRLEPTLARHRGRLVKLTGDGALVEFASAVDALGAAIEFQQAMAEVNSEQPEDTRIVFRIGLHLGDLIVDGDDLYGDGVNVAARLEGEAPAGGIVISRTVHEAVSGRLKATFEDLGALSLKNIERPVQAFGVKWEAGDWKVSATAASPTTAMPPVPDIPLTLPDKPSIAVLPFQNMSGDPEQEYFADGVVEDIITALSRFKSLFVIARNSSFTYKGKAVDVKQVGRELGVRYVLEGSVRKAAGQVRITGQLIDSANGAHLWADRFDGALDNIFELQDQVATNVVGAIAPMLDQVEIARARGKPAESLEAYDCYLRGLGHTHALTKGSWDEALRLFYRAIELDPDFSTPYGMAARCYNVRKLQGWMADQKSEEAETKRLASRFSSIGRDDALGLSWAGFALVYVCDEYDTGAALIDQALAINPNLAAAWGNRGLASVFLGQHEVAIEQTTRALRLSPLEPEAYRWAGIMSQALLFLGRYEEALGWTTKCLAHQPDWVPAIRIAVVAHALLGNIDEARRMDARWRQFNPSASAALRYRRPQDRARLAEGRRLVRIPE